MAPVPCTGAAHDTRETIEPLDFLALLFSENSPFRVAAATLVSRIDLNWYHPRSYIYSTNNVLLVRPELFECAEKGIELMKNILSACGQHVRRLSLGSVPYDEAKAKNFVAQFKWHVSSVEWLRYYLHQNLCT